MLGPSHHAYFTTCGLSTLVEYETPLGNLRVNREITEELHKTGHFEFITRDVEEAEHSLEMHLPYHCIEVHRIYFSSADISQR